MKLGVFALTLLCALPLRADDEVKMLLDRCAVTVTQPRAAVGGYTTMDNSPVQGNGCLMVTIGSTSNSLTLYLGKTDFWMDKLNKTEWQSANVLPGTLVLRFPSLAGAAFKQAQDMRLAETRTSFGGVEVRTVTPHESDNFVINDIVNTSSGTVPVEIETASHPHRKSEIAFDLGAGRDGDIAWATRKTPKPEETGFRMWAALATRVIGPVATVENTKQTFTLAPGQIARIVTKVHSTGLPVSLEPADPLPPALNALKTLTPDQVEAFLTGHRAWWDGYWRKSWVRLDAEPLVERVYFGALYVLGCAARVGQYPAGCNGWPVDDSVPWGGDYHWNYNNQATFYGVFSANRAELSEPYDRTVNEANEFGKRHAASKKMPGTLFYIATAPGHVNEELTINQKTHAVEAALVQINHWYYTFDVGWMKKNFAFLKDVAAYWDWDLQQHEEKLPGGAFRYVIRDSAPMEGASNDRFNGITGLAFLRRFYRAMIDITLTLHANGVETGCGGADLARWQEYLDKLSDYPLSYAYGRKVFAWSEQSLNPLLTEQDWILYPVFPCEQVTLSSDPALLRIARNTLIIKPQYYVEWLNNPPQIFSIAARLAHHPPEILERFKWYFRDLGVNNFKSGGGNTEGCGIAESVNSMLLQSHEGFLRLFPCWDRSDAKFVNIRATGAFLVSAEKKNGVCQPFTIISEKGGPCGVLNPWPGRTLTVNGIELAVDNKPFGQVCLFPTEPGQTNSIAPKEPLPASLPHWNAALYTPVTASSNHQPPNEKENWDAAKLTDGTRINTKAGHRGWSSALHDLPDATEWVQIDLGAAVPINAVNLWPLDHGDAWQHTHCKEPFVRSDEIDQSYDGFPLDFQILVSADGKKWDEVERRVNFRKPAVGPATSDLKPADVTGPEQFKFNARPVRYIKVEATKLRKTRTFGKHAACLAEIEAVRTDVAQQ
jgi:hypothetical protein